MRTLLIRPSTPRLYGIGGQSAFPLGLGYIAAVLEKQHDVDVVDAMAEKLNSNDLKDRIIRACPDIVGITSDTLTFQAAVEVAEIVKRVNRKIIVVVGGAHSNVLPSYPLKFGCFDISVHGEGERAAIALWDKLDAGEPYEDVAGIAFRRNGNVVVNPKQELISDLDSLPMPARHLFPMDKYTSLYSTMGTSRGCPFACSFCSNNTALGRKYRFRSSDSVTSEIELLTKRYGIKRLYFREDLFTLNRQRVMDLCDKIRSKGLSIEWECESRVDTVDKNVLIALKKAGCKLIWFGVESGSQRILDVLNKNISIPQVRETYRLCHDVGLKAGASFIIGVPGETDEDIKKTSDLANEIKPAFTWFNILTGYPTSPLYEHIREHKLYDAELGHGILIARTEQHSRCELERIQRRLSRMASLRRITSGSLNTGNIIRFALGMSRR